LAERANKRRDVVSMKAAVQSRAETEGERERVGRLRDSVGTTPRCWRSVRELKQVIASEERPRQPEVAAA